VGLSARDRRIRLSSTEQLESRVLMAAAPPMLLPPPGTTLLNPLTVPQFVNDITAINPFENFNYTPDASGNHYTVGAYEQRQDLLGLNDAAGNPLLTTVFGYGRTPPARPTPAARSRCSRARRSR
jgi:hypothetical protein